MSKEKSLVRVERIEEKKWHGKTGAESLAQGVTISVLYDPSTGKYATGLSEEDVEEGRKQGLDLSNNFQQDVPHPFWNSRQGQIRLNPTTTYFDPSNFRDLIKIKNLKASSLIANSKAELENGDYPDAKFYIVDIEQESKAKATLVQQKGKAYSLLSKMSADDKINMIQILSKESYKGLSNDKIDAEIGSLVETKTRDFIKYAEMDSTDVYIRAAILECLQKNILTKEGSSILYMGDTIAFDYEEAVQYFKNPQNQKMKVTILEKLTK